MSAQPRPSSDASAPPRVQRRSCRGRHIATLGALLACEPRTTQIDFDLVLPEDERDLDEADNASLVVEPDGTTVTFAIDGLDFAIGLDIEPSEDSKALSVYLADGQSLLAWGRSAPFVPAATATLGVLMLRPGRLSTFPGLIESPDPAALAARARGRGMIVLETDGSTFLLDEFRWQVEAGAALADPPPPEDGGLVPDGAGRLVRLTYEQAWSAHGFDPSIDAWSEYGTQTDLGLRPGAALLVDEPNQRALLFGGGSQTDVLAVALTPDESGALAATPLVGVTLDRPRDDATVSPLLDLDGATSGYLLWGGDSAQGASGGEPVWTWPSKAWTSTSPSPSPTSSWTGAACSPLGGPPTTHVLCVGGLRNGAATRAAAWIDLGTARWTLLEDLLPVAMPEPITLTDLQGPTAGRISEGAVYAQGEGQLLRIPVAAMPSPSDVEVVAGPALRARGGRSVTLANGVTFLAAGTAPDGAPLDRWQVFAPALPPAIATTSETP